MTVFNGFVEIGLLARIKEGKFVVSSKGRISLFLADECGFRGALQAMTL